jgi:hypothetical protein
VGREVRVGGVRDGGAVQLGLGATPGEHGGSVGVQGDVAGHGGGVQLGDVGGHGGGVGVQGDVAGHGGGVQLGDVAGHGGGVGVQFAGLPAYPGGHGGGVQLGTLGGQSTVTVADAVDDVPLPA